MGLELENIKPGDEVVYIPEHLQHIDNVHLEKNKGVVTSKNDRYAFVRYKDYANSQATRANDLIEDSEELNFKEEYNE